MAQYSKLQVLSAMKETGIVPVFYHADAAVAKQVGHGINPHGVYIHQGLYKTKNIF